jgi:glucose-1-phosphate thymidylyltransferase
MKPIALIPAGGTGSRLQPLPLPKELYPVGYQRLTIDGKRLPRPKVIAQYLLERIRAAGVRDFVIVLGPGKESVMEYFGSGARLGASIAYLHNDAVGSLPSALDLARPWVDGRTVLFGMPDTIIEPAAAFRKILAAHRRLRADLTLALFPTTTPSKFGMVDLGRNGLVHAIKDKPRRSAWRYMWGAAAWGPRFTEFLHAYARRRHRGTPVIGDVFDAALSAGLVVRALPFPNGRYMDIGTVDELDAALKRFHL